MVSSTVARTGRHAIIWLVLCLAFFLSATVAATATSTMTTSRTLSITPSATATSTMTTSRTASITPSTTATSTMTTSRTLSITPSATTTSTMTTSRTLSITPSVTDTSTMTATATSTNTSGTEGSSLNWTNWTSGCTTLGKALSVRDMGSKAAVSMARALLGSGLQLQSAEYIGSPTASGLIDFPCGHYLSNRQTGNFSASNSAVVLTSGGLDSALRTINMSPSASVQNGVSGDTDLDAIVAPLQTFDASILFMDLLVTAPGAITFSFVFASEEYDEFVGHNFNDVFALYVNAVNRALLPGSNRPISINTVNLYNNSAEYHSNSKGSLPMEYDGVTVKLATRPVPVAIGDRVSVKLAVSDVSDASYDTALFIESGSVAVAHDPCLLSPCGHGTCSVPIASSGFYACTCESGYENDGSTCIASSDPCVPINPCGPGVCQSEERMSVGYRCICRPGYSSDGLTCVSAALVNPCEPVNPCGPGVCLPEDNSYMCECSETFVSNGITCVPASSDPCVPNNPCGPGVCQSEERVGVGYRCICRSGYSSDGLTCVSAAAVNPCEPVNPCGPGVCLPKDGSYMCECNETFVGNGTSCVPAVAVNPCEPVNPCGPGVCLPKDGSYTCECNETFVSNSTSCVPGDPCMLLPCGAGSCNLLDIGVYNCTCDAGGLFNGVTCVLGCDMAPCGPGMCFAEDVGYRCECPGGYASNNVTCVLTDSPQRSMPPSPTIVQHPLPPIPSPRPPDPSPSTDKPQFFEDNWVVGFDVQRAMEMSLATTQASEKADSAASTTTTTGKVNITLGIVIVLLQLSGTGASIVVSVFNISMRVRGVWREYHKGNPERIISTKEMGRAHDEHLEQSSDECSVSSGDSH